MAHEKTFYLKNGKVFSSLEKFAKELQTMKDDVFEHHVNPTKHDFKEWVNHSMKKENLAEALQDKITKIEVELEVLRHLVHDKSKKIAKKPEKKVPSKKADSKSTVKSKNPANKTSSKKAAKKPEKKASSKPAKKSPTKSKK